MKIKGKNYKVHFGISAMRIAKDELGIRLETLADGADVFTIVDLGYAGIKAACAKKEQDVPTFQDYEDAIDSDPAALKEIMTAVSESKLIQGMSAIAEEGKK